MTAGTGLESLWDEKRRSYNNGYEAGFEVAEERYTPLIEAARAYREAHVGFYEPYPGDSEWLKCVEAKYALLKAARTFEGPSAA